MKRLLSFCLTLCATATLWAAFTPAAFTVSAEGKQIAFSQGNLQCSGVTSGTYTWSFAENQYDVLGTANISDSKLADKIDLFGWSTNNETTKWGISISATNSDYSGDFVEWGKNIGDGTIWRTLTQDEWTYLLNTRADASNKKGIARINPTDDGSQYVNGLILLPDNWESPDGITFNSGFETDNSEYAYSTHQTFTLTEWQKLEAAGAVFLPATGERVGANVKIVQSFGYYWSATAYYTSSAYPLSFYSKGAYTTDYRDRYNGYAVRFVQDYVPTYKVTLGEFEHGNISPDKAEYTAGETVTLTVTPDAYYALKSLAVLQGTTAVLTTAVENTTNQYTFTMPAGNVNITAEFEKLASAFKPALFTISKGGKQVYFSQGNLQCAGLTKKDTTWSFAEYQTDMLGTANISGEELADKIDLFGWSGSTGSAKWGISTSTDFSDYSGDFVDWGQNIGDGTTYRTLTKDEWEYLLDSRANASDKIGVACIKLTDDGSQYANGLILLPDNWTYSGDIRFKSGFVSDYISQTHADHQTFTLAEWQQLEAAGAVFLPASEERTGAIIYFEQSYGYYWSATAYESYNAYHLSCDPDEAYTEFLIRFNGCAVRLVRDLRFAIAITTPEHGGIVPDKAECAAGDPVTLTITPEAGYELDELKVIYGGEQSITPTAVAETTDKYTFTMPASAVTVSATFKAIPDTKEAVDLGLPSGLLWATCNVGAYAPQAYGNYYAWGETNAKTTYSWDTYTHGTSSDNLTKYTGSDDLTTLEADDDAAAQNWGDNWRMPTDNDWKELKNNCEWTWTSNYNNTGIAGRIVTSKTNSNSIFLPAAGYRDDDKSENVGSVGDYWSSSLYTGNSGRAWYAYFNSSRVDQNGTSRYYGHSVRPVQDAPKYAVNINTAANGQVTADFKEAFAGRTITLTITPEAGYELDELKVVYGEEQSITPTAVAETTDKYTFTMPASAVTVSATFKAKTPTALNNAEQVVLYVEHGRIVCDGAFQIFDLLGRNVTHLNGSLNGVYVVKLGDKAQKVVVR